MNMTPTRLAEVAKEIARVEKLECRIFDRSEMEKKGMGGLLAVSRGSEEPPKFIHLCYEPKGSVRKTVAIVGKGITFDSGGLCIKPRDNMRTMKGDMSGAACVLGVMKAVPKLNPSVRVHGLISATENMPGARAYKPDDIIRALNGKTIEVIDTDAEGRIVLSDALSYAVELKVDEIVDQLIVIYMSQSFKNLFRILFVHFSTNYCVAISSSVHPGAMGGAPAFIVSPSSLPTNDMCPIGYSHIIRCIEEVIGLSKHHRER